MDRAACVDLITAAGIPVPPKSSCWFCPFHKLSEWRKKAEDKPEEFARAVELETMLNSRFTSLGRGRAFLTTKLVPLSRVTEQQGIDLNMDDDATCDVAGYCHS